MKNRLAWLAVLGGVCGALSTYCGSSTPCGNLGCPSLPGTLVLKVDGAGGQAIASPTFSEAGKPLAATCESDASPCDTWRFPDTLGVGPHTITVSAPGFEAATVGVTITGPAGCCGSGPEVDQSVTLAAAPVDAGTD